MEIKDLLKILTFLDQEIFNKIQEILEKEARELLINKKNGLFIKTNYFIN